MDFRLTDEQALVRETARELFSRECDLDVVRAAFEDPTIGRELHHKHLHEWLDLAEAGAVERMLFLEEYGRAAAPGPLLSSLLARHVAAAAGEPLEGTATVAIAGADGLWRPNDEATKHFVADAVQVEEWLVVSGSPDAPRIARMPVDSDAATPIAQMDALRPISRVEVRAAGEGRPFDGVAFEEARLRALVDVSSELIGVGRHLLDTAVAYASEREQFGVPVGSFQGLQWMMVDAALALERAAASVSYAAMCVDAKDGDRHAAVPGAKAEAGLAARECARTSMQVHAGIGYTFEHGLHYWLRRAYAGDAFMGPSDHHLDALAAQLLDA